MLRANIAGESGLAGLVGSGIVTGLIEASLVCNAGCWGRVQGSGLIGLDAFGGLLGI